MSREILTNDSPPEVYEFTGDRRLWGLMQRGLLNAYQVTEMSKWPKEHIERLLLMAKSVANPVLFTRLMEGIGRGEEPPEEFFKIYPDGLSREAVFDVNVCNISVEKAILLARLPVNEQRYLLEAAKDESVDAAAFASKVDNYLARDPEYRGIIAILDENFDAAVQWAGAYDIDDNEDYAEQVEAEREKVKDYINRLYTRACN